MTPESLFHAALAKSDPIERSGFLDEACGTDQKLRQEIEALLQAHAGCGEFMGKPAVEQTAAFDPDNTTGFSLQTIDQIGPYKLREKLGEGGMGTVYVADQKEPVQRRVAIKLIKGGSDSKGLLARFEQERQALALMDHPNIAKVFDAGVFERTPYFVMELIKGVRITKYCDDARLSPKQRLELFIPVCQAVQHAHQKGIIHRDLKPSNILIGLYDGKPIPKIIDFGVAKATGSRLTDQSIYTEVGSLVGTLEYMSPEQAELNNLDIDTRSDIYALGVILYELLTGSVPFSRKDLAAAGFGEMLRVIKEVEPTKPSTKLSGSGTLPSIAASRQTEPAKLSSIVRGELDWIVMKCLEKDRGRRYETANQLGMEIQRYLADEPVLAGPPSAGYRLRKFVARNKGKVIAAGLVFLTLVAGIAGTSWGLYREAQRAEGERLAKLDAEKAAAAERVANEQTQKRLKQIEKGNAVLTAVFDDLNIIYVKEGKEPLEAVLAKRLVKAGGQLEGDSVGDPLVVASLQFRLGKALDSLGHSQEAIPLFLKTRETRLVKLGAEHPDTLSSMNALAMAYHTAGKSELAIPLFEEAFKLQNAKLGSEHQDTVATMHNLALAYKGTGKLDLAIPLLEKSLRISQKTRGLTDPGTALFMQNLAGAYQNSRRFDLAQKLYKEAFEQLKTKVGPDHPFTLNGMYNLARLYFDTGRLDLAQPLFEETLRLQNAKLGSDHPNTILTKQSLARVYFDIGKLDLAQTLYEETLRLQNAKLGSDHANTILTKQSLARVYFDVGKLNLAQSLYEETLRLQNAKLGPDHPYTLDCIEGLAETFLESGNHNLALSHYEEAFKLRKAKMGPAHPDTLLVMGKLAWASTVARHYERAIPLYEQLWELRKQKLPESNPNRIDSQNLLGLSLLLAGRLTEAEQHLLTSIRQSASSKNFPSEWRQAYALRLICLYLELRRTTDVAHWQDELKKLGGATDTRRAQTGLQMLQTAHYNAAELMLRECLTLREKECPNDWRMFNTQSMLGGALLGQKKYDDAEPLLLKGYEGMKAREKTIPPQGSTRLPEALDRLIQFYTETNKPDEVKKWQAEKAKYAKPSEKK